MTDLLNRIIQENSNLRIKLNSLVNVSSENSESEAYDVLVSPCEINHKHGTGVLLHRIFIENSDRIFSIRSSNLYGGEHVLGGISVRLSHQGLSRSEAFVNVARCLEGRKIRRVICVPFYSDDLITTLAIQELFRVPSCIYVMDDQNVCVNNIPDPLMAEALSKASLRLTISAEMRCAYERKYNYKFHWVPSVAPHDLLQTEARTPFGKKAKTKTGVLLGSIWGRGWLDLLQETIKGSGLKLDWYGNIDAGAGAAVSKAEDLAVNGIFARGFLPETDLVSSLRQYLYAVIPYGRLDESDDNPAIARLSLPSRISYILATSGTPIILLGSKETAAAKFIERFKIGVVCDYGSENFLAAVEHITSAAVQSSMRHNAAQVAETFSADGIADWIWQSMEQGAPQDRRFDSLAPRRESDLIYYIESPAPKIIQQVYAPIYQVFKRLQIEGFNPSFVVDVGASVGVWSRTVSELFPSARFILLEPLLEEYFKSHPSLCADIPDNFEVLQTAVSNQVGQVCLQVSPDLYGSSLMQPSDFREYKSVQVNVTTLDQLAKEKSISGQGLLKIDVQFAEHLVLEGGKEFLSQVDVLVVELSLIRYADTAKTFTEMIQTIQDLGFRYYDDVDGWRLPEYGTLLQKDSIFVKQGLFLPRLD